MSRENPDEISSIFARSDDAVTWASAEELIKKSVYFASSFSTAVRFLKANEAENFLITGDLRRLNDASKFYARRLLRAPSLLSPLYFLSKTFLEEKLKGESFLSRDYLISLYKPGDLASFFALVYLFHNLRKINDPEEWGRFSKMVVDLVEIAGTIGQRIPELGFANSMLFVGMRYLSNGVFMRHDAKSFRAYRRECKMKGVMFIPKMEQGLWGCTHHHVATRLLQKLGFGLEPAEAFYRALETPPDREVDTFTNAIRLSVLWTDALYLGKKPPVIKGEEQLVTSEYALDQIVDTITRIKKEGSQYAWLAKRRSAINRKLVPELYPADYFTAERDDDNQNLDTLEEAFFISYDDLPDKIKKHFTEDEFNDTASEVQDLIDEN